MFLSVTRLHYYMDMYLTYWVFFFILNFLLLNFKQRSIVIWTVTQPHIQDSCCCGDSDPVFPSSLFLCWSDKRKNCLMIPEDWCREVTFPRVHRNWLFFIYLFLFSHWSELDNYTKDASHLHHFHVSLSFTWKSYLLNY